MWISKDQWDRMNERLDKCEQSQQRLRDELNSVQGQLSMRFYDDTQATMISYSLGSRLNSMDVSLADAIRKIADHLGLKFKYIAGTPKTVSLEKIKT